MDSVLPTAARANWPSVSNSPSVECEQNAHVFVPEVLLSDPLDVLGGDGVDVSLNLLGRVSLAGGDHLSADLVDLACASIYGRHRLTSSAMAVVPSRLRRREAFSCDFARSTSPELGETDIRCHSLRVKWIRSSTFMRLSVSTYPNLNKRGRHTSRKPCRYPRDRCRSTRWRRTCTSWRGCWRR